MQHDDGLLSPSNNGDREDGLTTPDPNRPNAFNLLSKDLLTALQAELTALPPANGARRGHCRRRQGLLLRA